MEFNEFNFMYKKNILYNIFCVPQEKVCMNDSFVRDEGD